MSSAKAGIAMMAATSNEKNNLTASSLRGCERRYGASPCFARFGYSTRAMAHGPPLGLGPRQIILQSLAVAPWHEDVKLLPPLWLSRDRGRRSRTSMHVRFAPKPTVGARCGLCGCKRAFNAHAPTT